SSFDTSSPRPEAKEDRSTHLREARADGPMRATSQTEIDAPSPPQPTRLRFTFLRGVIVARLTIPDSLDASDLDAMEGELVNLIACGGQSIVLDLGGISGMADRTPAVLARVHRACVVAGGQLKLGDLCPALAGAAASAGMDQVPETLPNEDSAR